MKRDFQKEMESEITSLDGRRPRLLLHSCCAPCTSAVLERLYPHFDVTLFYFNPNIQPEDEYEKRYAELPKLLRAAGMEDVSILRGNYDTALFLAEASGLEDAPEGGERCGKCFRLRLGAAADEAKSGGFEYFCTTLTVSPHKDAVLINSIGESLSARCGVKWLPSDFKKKDGYLRSIRLSQQYGLYRQCYCGCMFSSAGRKI